MSEHSGSWQEGFNDGYAWYTDAKEIGPLEQADGFGIPNEPYRSDDEEYNAGVADGIAEARAQS
jgi:hypothetical protein